ncbi:MAG: PKD domain-containing protein [Chitinophagales bacterium]
MRLHHVIRCAAKYLTTMGINSNFHFMITPPTTQLHGYGILVTGTTSTSTDPMHSYGTQGTWNVCLTITDGSGCSSSYCEQVSNVLCTDLLLFYTTKQQLHRASFRCGLT